MLLSCRAASAATAAINSPLRLGPAHQASSMLVLINAPQDSTTAEVRFNLRKGSSMLACAPVLAALSMHALERPVLDLSCAQKLLCA